MPLKVVPFDKTVYGFLLVFYSNFVPKMNLFEIFNIKKCRDLEIQVTKGHRNRHVSICHL